MRVIIWTLIILFFSAPAWAEYPSKEQVRNHIKAVSRVYGVDPAFSLAVAQMESTKHLKCGQLNKERKWSKKLFGPFGVRGCFLETGDPFEVIKVGVASFQGTDSDADKIARLKTYNPEWRKGNYIQDVMKQYAFNKRQGGN